MWQMDAELQLLNEKQFWLCSSVIYKWHWRLTSYNILNLNFNSRCVFVYTVIYPIYVLVYMTVQLIRKLIWIHCLCVYPTNTNKHVWHCTFPLWKIKKNVRNKCVSWFDCGDDPCTIYFHLNRNFLHGDESETVWNLFWNDICESKCLPLNRIV